MHYTPAIRNLAVALCAATLLSGCNDQPAETPKAELPKVGVLTLQPSKVNLSDDLPGRTAAFRAAQVRPQVDGIILKRLFTEGSEIKAGQQLYQIDPATYQAELASSQATAKQYRSLTERYRQLIDEQAVSRQEYDTAQSQQQQAEARVQTAQINLRYTKVLAPISGRVGRSSVTEGALVTNGQAAPLATIQQLDPIYVDVTQSYAQMLQLRRALDEGQLEMAGDNVAKVNLTLEDDSVYAHAGKLEFSEVSVDETTGSVTLRAVFPNPDHVLLPGMFVHATLPAGVVENALLAPQTAVTRDLRGTPTAMVLGAGNKVEPRELKTTRTVGNDWLVEAGLQPGDKLIVDGLQFIKPGAAVSPHEATEAATASPSANANVNATLE